LARNDEFGDLASTLAVEPVDDSMMMDHSMKEHAAIQLWCKTRFIFKKNQPTSYLDSWWTTVGVLTCAGICQHPQVLP
jgi:hypothetical protein